MVHSHTLCQTWETLSDTICEADCCCTHSPWRLGGPKAPSTWDTPTALTPLRTTTRHQRLSILLREATASMCGMYGRILWHLAHPSLTNTPIGSSWINIAAMIGSRVRGQTGCHCIWILLCGPHLGVPQDRSPYHTLSQFFIFHAYSSRVSHNFGLLQQCPASAPRQSGPPRLVSCDLVPFLA